jgi:hypothetical protein
LYIVEYEYYFAFLFVKNQVNIKWWIVNTLTALAWMVNEIMEYYFHRPFQVIEKYNH